MARRESKFPPQQDELYYYDENSNTYKAIADSDGMLPIQSVQKKWRDSFSVGSALDDTKWDIIQTGAGQTVTQANGVLDIVTGVTTNSETIIQTKEFFSDPFRAMASIRMTQKIANQAVFFEAVSINPVTKEPDGLHSVAWRISGDDNVTNDFAVYETQSGGLARLASSAVDTNVVHVGATATSFGIFELELFADEVWYHARVMDSASGRAYSAVRHQQIPEPNALFKIRIRVLNKGVAPASSTTVSLQYVTVIDYAELTAEITAGRGSTSAGQGIAVNGSVGVSGTVTANFGSPQGTVYTDTVANLTTSGQVYTGTTRDMGASTQGNHRFRVTVMHNNASYSHGHIVIEQSTDGTTWRETHKRPVPADGLYRTMEYPIMMRYIRVKFINGTVAQTGMFIGTLLVKFDGTFNISRNLPFTDSIANLGASATFTSISLDVGGNNEYKQRRVAITTSHDVTVYVEQSRDGTNWRTMNQVTALAGKTTLSTDDIMYRYLRYRVVNGATALTLFEAQSTLSE